MGLLFEGLSSENDGNFQRFFLASELRVEGASVKLSSLILPVNFYSISRYESNSRLK